MIHRSSTRESYTRIDNAILNDSRLSWRARGVMAYLLSKPDEWIARPAEVMKHGKEGRDAIQIVFRELESLGYMKLVHTPGKGSQWVVFESPEPENLNLSISEPREPENPVPENQALSTPENLIISSLKSRSLSNEGEEVKKSTKGELFSDVPKSRKPKPKFVPPTVMEVEEFMASKGLNGNSSKVAKDFTDWYGESKWHKSNGDPVTNWRLAAVGWLSRMSDRSKTHNPPPSGLTKADLEFINQKESND